jgi:hypothetical protein
MSNGDKGQSNNTPTPGFMKEKDKWKYVMKYMEENPSFLLDAIPSPTN